MLQQIIQLLEYDDVLILQGLDRIYDSLYDMLNRNYTQDATKETCRITVGSVVNNWCAVHPKFRCVVIMDEKEAKQAGSPFLNRFEKQFITLKDLLSSDEHRNFCSLKQWMEKFSTVTGSEFTLQDAFLANEDEVIASIVAEFSSLSTRDDLLSECQSRLLKVTTADAVFRLPRSNLGNLDRSISSDFRSRYFDIPIHGGLLYFLNSFKDTKTTKAKHAIYTYSKVHTNIAQICSGYPIKILKLNNVASEKTDFGISGPLS